MLLFSYSVLFMFLSTFKGLTAIDEPVCTSRFDFEEKLLSKLVRMEHAMELLQERVSNELSAIKEEKAQMDQYFLKFKEAFKNECLEKMSVYESKIQRISGDLGEVLNKSLNNEKIAFAAHTATAELVNGVPTFVNTHVNIGNAYDISTGKFTCNKDGLYSFTFILRSKTSGFVFCYIRRNEVRLNYAITEGKNNMSSVTVYLSLSTGDVVDIGECANWDNYNVNIYGTLFLGMEIN